MTPPDELMVKAFLPSVRALVARRLSEEGLSQGKISRLLGVTQASVHYYLTGDSQERYEKLKGLGFEEGEVKGFVEALCEDVVKGGAEGLRTLYSFWIDALAKGRICDAHKRLHPNLKECDICMMLFSRAKEGDGALVNDVREAVKLIETSPYFTKVMPEVSVNIVLAREGAKTVEDVLAVPGRIVKVMERPKALMEPRFGASTHMARVVLLAHKRDHKARAVINLKFDERVGDVLRGLSLNYRFIPRKGEELLTAIERELREGVPEALIDRGAVGIEPMTYLFGRSAKEVARIALRVARLYSL